MDYVNNWQRPITLGSADTSVALDLPDGTYRLSISDADRSLFEVVEAVVTSGTATLTRALEGTTAQEWAAGSSIYCSVTAGVLAGFGVAGGVYRGDGEPDGVVSAPGGSHYIDNLDPDVLWYAADDDYWLRFKPDFGLSLGVGSAVFRGDRRVSAEGVLTAGAVVVFDATVQNIFTSAALATEGAERKFTATGQPHYYRAAGSGSGDLFFTVTPLTVSAPPAP